MHSFKMRIRGQYRTLKAAKTIKEIKHQDMDNFSNLLIWGKDIKLYYFICKLRGEKD